MIKLTKTIDIQICHMAILCKFFSYIFTTFPIKSFMCQFVSLVRENLAMIERKFRIRAKMYTDNYCIFKRMQNAGI